MKKLYIVEWSYEKYLVLARNGGEALKEVVGDMEGYEDDQFSVKEFNMNGKTRIVSDEVGTFDV